MTERNGGHSIFVRTKNQTGIELLTYFKNLGLQYLNHDSHPIAILDHTLSESEAVNPQLLKTGIRCVAHNGLNVTS